MRRTRAQRRQPTSNAFGPHPVREVVGRVDQVAAQREVEVVVGERAAGRASTVRRSTDGQREERPCRLAEHPALADPDGVGDLGEEPVDVRREQRRPDRPARSRGRSPRARGSARRRAAEAAPRPLLGLVGREGGDAPGVVHQRLGPPLLVEAGVELGPVGGTELGQPAHHPPAQVEVEREASGDPVGQPPAQLVDVGVRGDDAPQGGKGQARGRIGGCEPGTERLVETTGHRVRVADSPRPACSTRSAAS